MRRTFNNFDEIKMHLKRLSLERQIALEELKGLKHDVKEGFSPNSWMGTAVSVVKKYGLLYIMRKIFR